MALGGQYVLSPDNSAKYGVNAYARGADYMLTRQS
jgi:hypothetical protein